MTAEESATTVAEPGSTVVWTGHPHAPAPIAAIRAASQPRVVVDEARRRVPFGAGALLRETLRGVWLRALDLGLGALATLSSSRTAPAVRRDRAGDGPVVVVLPILPDLSHTFVYREALTMLRLRPDWRIVVLQRNPGAPVHTEAAAVRERATYLKRDGITARALRVLRWLCRRPGRELFALYRSQPNGRAADLLGKLPLREPRHPGNAFLLADELAPLRPRHVHVYSSTYPANVALAAAHLLGVPASISSYVDFEFPYDFRMLGDKLRRAKFFRVVTRFCAERLAELGRDVAPDLELDDDRIPTVYLGLALDEWQDEPQPARRGVIVSAARLVPKKGLHLVPPALAALREQGVAVEWRVLGDGPERARLERLCDEHGVRDLAHFLGAQDNAAVRRELLTCDLAMLPCVVADDGERDGIPIFLCEAMALGVPVLSTPISGIPELVRDRDTGYLCNPNDSGALAAAITAALAAPDERDAIAARGRALVRELLDIDVAVADLVRRIEA